MGEIFGSLLEEIEKIKSGDLNLVKKLLNNQDSLITSLNLDDAKGPQITSPERQRPDTQSVRQIGISSIRDGIFERCKIM